MAALPIEGPRPGKTTAAFLQAHNVSVVGDPRILSRTGWEAHTHVDQVWLRQGSKPGGIPRRVDFKSNPNGEIFGSAGLQPRSASESSEIDNAGPFFSPRKGETPQIGHVTSVEFTDKEMVIKGERISPYGRTSAELKVGLQSGEISILQHLS